MTGQGALFGVAESLPRMERLLQPGEIASLADYVMQARPPFPLLNREPPQALFQRLCLDDLERLWVTGRRVVTKHADYPAGPVLAVTQLGHLYNAVSDYYQRENRMRCGGYDRLSPWGVWTGEGLTEEEWRKALRSLLAPLARPGMNNMGRVTDAELRFCLRLSSVVYTAAQFKVHAAAQVMRYFGGGRVLDFSMGWGDRLAAAAASRLVTAYVGTDPNPQVHQGYAAQMQDYRRWRADVLGDDIETLWYDRPAEEVPWAAHGPFDLIFTSPPYSGTERYAKGTQDERSQSWSRYPEDGQWWDGFLRPVLDSTVDALRPGGILALNILDPDRAGKRFRLCDLLMGHLSSLHFLGMVGLRMKQRPKSWASQVAKTEYMSSVYAEPIWVWRK